MARTYRHRINTEISSYRKFLRKPKTLNEMRQNDSLISDINCGDFEYKLSAYNRIICRKNLPTLLDDTHISGYFEDYQNKHFYD